jgi:hypothetical protein
MAVAFRNAALVFLLFATGIIGYTFYFQKGDLAFEVRLNDLDPQGFFGLKGEISIKVTNKGDHVYTITNICLKVNDTANNEPLYEKTVEDVTINPGDSIELIEQFSVNYIPHEVRGQFDCDLYKDNVFQEHVSETKTQEVPI